MDYLMICGGYQMRPPLPYVPGTDAAGVVVACGEKVNRFHPGDRVACENWFGGFAERIPQKPRRLRVFRTISISLSDRRCCIFTSRLGMRWSIAHGYKPAKPFS